MPYPELVARSCYSLLEGASQPSELLQAAARAGVSHVGPVDRDAVHGLVQAHRAPRDPGVALVCGATVTVDNQPPVVLLAEDHRGWSRLCRLLTFGRADEHKGRARLDARRVAEHAEGLSCILRYGWTPESAAELREAFG